MFRLSPRLASRRVASRSVVSFCLVSRRITSRHDEPFAALSRLGRFLYKDYKENPKEIEMKFDLVYIAIIGVRRVYEVIINNIINALHFYPRVKSLFLTVRTFFKCCFTLHAFIKIITANDFNRKNSVVFLTV